LSELTVQAVKEGENIKDFEVKLGANKITLKKNQNLRVKADGKLAVEDRTEGNFKIIVEKDQTVDETLQFEKKFYKMITIIADTYQSAIITILLVALLYIKKYYREALFLTVTMSVCGLAMPLLKNIFSRERPNFHRLIEISGYSFPSGHTTSATTMYLTLAIILLSIMKKLNKYFVFSIAVLGIVIIGSSRIYLGVHYPTDVMAGICLGISIVSTVYILYYSNSSKEVK